MGAFVVNESETLDLFVEPTSAGEFIRIIPFSFDIMVDPNGDPVDTVDAFLNFDPGFAQVSAILPGATLENVTLSTFDNVLGTVDYSADTSGAAPTAEFVLATVTLTPTTPTASTEVSFNLDLPRKSDAIFGPVSVLKSVSSLDLRRVVETETSPDSTIFFDPGTSVEGLALSIFGPPTAITQTTPVDDNTPTFVYSAPPVPVPDIISVEVRILPDGTAFTDIGKVTTFTVAAEDALLDGDYIFQVRMISTGDRKDSIGSLEFFIETGVLPSPVLVAPIDGAFLNSGDLPPLLFDWNAPTTGDPVNYQLLVNRLNDPLLVVDEVILAAQTSFDLITGDELADTEYEWQVLVTDDLANTADSAINNFFIDTIAPPPPADLAEDTTGDVSIRQFSWTQVLDVVPPAPGITGDESGVDFYNVVIAGDSLPEPTIATLEDETCAAGTCVFTTDVLDPGTYTITVSTVDNAGNTGDESDPFPFTTVPPISTTLIFPIGGVFLTEADLIPLAFDWAAPASGDPVSYQVLVTRFNDSLLVVDEDVADPQTNFDLFTGDDLVDTRYQWHVIVTDALDNTADSPVGNFSIDTTAPPPPSDLTEDTIGDSPVREFSWTQVLDVVPPPPGIAGEESGVDFYNVVITGDTLAEPSVATLDDNGANCPGGTCVFTTEVLDPGIYSIVVSTVDNAGNTGDESDPLDFATVVLTPPALVSPIDGVFLNESNLTPIQLDWDAPSTGETASYQVFVTRVNDDEDVVVAVGLPPTPTGFLVVTGDELADTSYRWQVVAIDGLSNTADSLPAIFSIDTTPPAAPSDVTDETIGEVTDLTFNWSEVSDVVPPDPGTTGDESGVDFYNVFILGVFAESLDNDTGCPAGTCEFNISLSPGLYDI